VRILTWNVLKVSRDVVGLLVSPTDETLKALTLQFAVLEPGDGATLRVIYDGPRKTGMEFKGACLDAPKPTILPADPIYSVPRVKRFKEAYGDLLSIALIGAVLIPVIGGVGWVTRRWFGEHVQNILFLGLFCGMGALALFGITYSFVTSLKRMTAPYLPPDIKE
jgi:hypothetical protein